MFRFTKLALASIGFALAVGAATPAQAVIYYLNQSNEIALPDGTNYLKVEITSVDADTWKFQVSALLPPLVSTGNNTGVDTFAFNSTQALAAVNPITFGTPGYASQGGGNADGFGGFENRVGSTTGTATTTPIEFFVNFAAPTGSGWWQENSTGNAGQGNFWFAAHVQDINAGTDTEGLPITSAWFGGNVPGVPPADIPEPGTLALLGLALAGIGFARRRS